MAHKRLNHPVQINTDILNKWLTGRGKQPVTWAALVEALNNIELSTLAGDIQDQQVSFWPANCKHGNAYTIVCTVECYHTVCALFCIP